MRRLLNLAERVDGAQSFALGLVEGTLDGDPPHSGERPSSRGKVVERNPVGRSALRRVSQRYTLECLPASFR